MGPILSLLLSGEYGEGLVGDLRWEAVANTSACEIFRNGTLLTHNTSILIMLLSAILASPL